MDTPDISKLKSDVSKYIKKSKKTVVLEKLTFILSEKYILIPILVFISLIIFRPSFVYETVITRKGNVTKFSFKKLISYWLIISIILNLGIFGYYYSKDK